MSGPQSQGISADDALALALRQAKLGLTEGGIPIGSILLSGGTVVGAGHNRRVQLGDPILHAEMDAFRAAGRRSGAAYRQMTLVSTLSPCHMCTGAILLFGVAHVIIGESQTFTGPEWLLERAGVQITRLDSAECRQMMADFIAANPELWGEDIGK